jgi:hypothetical protein
MKKEIGDLGEKIQRYRDMGLFADEKDRSVNTEFDINLIDTLSIEIVQRWKNKHNLIINERIPLYRDIRIFN